MPTKLQSGKDNKQGVNKMVDESKCICITFVNKVSVGSVNDGFTEYNITTVKKLSKPNGDTLPYISGQALRRMIRDRWEEMGLEVSPLRKVEGTENYASQCNPETYIDDDLFGYMDPKEKSRTGPIRFSAAVGLFPFRSDRDMGTRSITKLTKDKTSGGNIFESEIYYNYFRSTILIELDRIGVFGPGELGKGDKGKSLDGDKKKERLGKFLQALYHLWGGGKQARFATDVGPMFMIYTRQKHKRPYLLEVLTMNDDEEINLDPISEIIENSEQTGIQRYIVGLRSGIFPNESKLKEKLNAVSLEEALKQMEEDLGRQFVPKESPQS